MYSSTIIGAVHLVLHDKGSLQIQILCNRQIHHEIVRTNSYYIKELVSHFQSYCIHVTMRMNVLSFLEWVSFDTKKILVT